MKSSQFLTKFRICGPKMIVIDQNTIRVSYTVQISVTLDAERRVLRRGLAFVGLFFRGRLQKWQPLNTPTEKEFR